MLFIVFHCRSMPDDFLVALRESGERKVFGKLHRERERKILVYNTFDFTDGFMS